MLLITGASGHIGGRAAELVLAAGQPLRLMIRNEDPAPTRADAQVVRADYADADSLGPAFAGVSTALIVSGGGAPGQRALTHKNAFEAAARAHVGHVIYLSLQGASPDSKYPYNRDHDQSERFLAATGVPHTILRDSFYMDMFLDKFDAHGVIRGPAGDGRGAFVSREDVAQTAAAALLSPPGGTLDVTGPESLTVAEIATRLSKIQGRPLRFENESSEAMRARLQKEEWPSGKIDLEVGWFEAIGAGELAATTDTVEKLTGRKPLRLEQYLNTFSGLKVA